MDTINSTTYHEGSNIFSIRTFAETNGYVKPNAINIYVPHKLVSGSGQSTYVSTSVAVIAGVINNTSILSHELAHSFNIIHTFGKNPYRPDPVNCERVTRDPQDPNYNAGNLGIGDEVVDTNAVPNFFREQHNHFANAVENAGLGYNWYQARQLSFRQNGFNDLSDAAQIELALLSYGFLQYEINYLRYNPAINDAYTDFASCTYTPDNRINDPQSPFFKDCGGTPYQVTQLDLQNIMAYSDVDCIRLFTTGQGIRIHETIAGNPSIFNPLLVPSNEKDLYIQDTAADIGQEPNIHTEVLWNSQDIWIRNQNDGLINQEHQNPVYNPSNPNYVYVKVRNKGCNTSSGFDELKLYWAKANTSLNWPEYWNGDVVINNIKMGDTLGTKFIRSISSGQEDILEFEWFVPNPQDYVGINPNPWHFCLLARIESDDDPMSFPEGSFITDNVRNNNNIGWKNTTVIEIYPSTLSVGGVIGVSNPAAGQKSYSLELLTDTNEAGKPIYQEAEISIEMDDVLYNAWERGNKLGTNFLTTSNNKKIIASGNNVLIDNIAFNANEYGTAYISFNFLTKELTNKQNYTYQVIQRDKAINKIIGGETYEIKKQPRGAFTANAGNNEEIDRNETITIQADSINEDAVYNWYDPEGNLIHSGTSLTITPVMSQQYKLEIISNLDGLKDYDDVEVTVKPYRIVSMSPNPVNTQLDIEYMVDGVTSAYIMVVNQNTGQTDNYIIDVLENEGTIDFSQLAIGLYSIILVCDGQIQETKTLVKN